LEVQDEKEDIINTKKQVKKYINEVVVTIKSVLIKDVVKLFFYNSEIHKKTIITQYNKMVEEAYCKLFKTDLNNFIFIYTPPKVGSTTLVTSLRISLGNSYNIIHIHDDLMLNVLTGINNVSINDLINYISRKGKNVHVIDVYREPIERKMSEFFEKISCYHFNNSEENINNYKISRVTDRFNRLFPHLANEEHYFDKYNIKNPITFNFQKKYTVQVINGIQYVKLRLMDSKEWGRILSEILHNDIVLINDYRTEQKGFAKLYSKFKKEYCLPVNYLELIKKCKYFNFYFSEQERNNYLQRWQKNICKDIIPYSYDEYKFYITICLENQVYDDIQLDHYLDCGCKCKCCSLKRQEIFFKAKRGETVTEKIRHVEAVKENITKKNQNVVKFVKKLNEIAKLNKTPKSNTLSSLLTNIVNK